MVYLVDSSLLVLTEFGWPVLQVLEQPLINLSVVSFRLLSLLLLPSEELFSFKPRLPLFFFFLSFCFLGWVTATQVSLTIGIYVSCV